METSHINSPPAGNNQKEKGILSQPVQSVVVTACNYLGRGGFHSNYYYI